MALKFKRKPENLAEGRLLLVESDAGDELAAIAEVEQWCAANGFRRFQEYHLPTKRRRDGTVVRVARCYRMYAQERKETAF